MSYLLVLGSKRLRMLIHAPVFVLTIAGICILSFLAVWEISIDLPVTQAQAPPAISQKLSNVTLVTILDNLGDEGRWTSILHKALEELRERHPEMQIEIEYNQYQYPNERTEFLESMSNKTHVDLMSIDQIWLGEFAERGLLTDLSPFINNWSRSSSDWYQVNWDGGSYDDGIYGIWLWTDVRGTYYWKDMLNESGVDPAMLSRWDTFLEAAKKLNTTLNGKGINGVHLTGASHSPDLWYPYLWMLGGDIVERRSGHPTKGVYWFPAYNGSEGVEALQFLKSQVDVGIVPQKNHSWGEEFVNRDFAVMMEASHVPLYFQPELPDSIKEKVGFLQLPIPDKEGASPVTMMGGWELGIPVTSQNKDLAWELITLIAEPVNLAPWLARYGYLPTQLDIGEGTFANELRQHNPFYDEMVSMIPTGLSRPSIPEYPQISDNIREAIEEVYYDNKQPKDALRDAALKSAQILGW
jgi:multiple sugar transport system substrate-binding protein